MSAALNQRRAAPLQTVWVDVPEHALEAYEQALGSVCTTIGFFLDEASGTWRVEGVREAAADPLTLIAALAVAAAVSGVDAPLQRADTAAEGWLARTRAAFPEQRVGRRFVVRGTHLPPMPAPGRIALVLDAGLAFGSGEHGSTRGCLMALEALARHRPARVLDLGTGSGILAIAAARLWPCLTTPVLATDIDPWSVRVARENAAANGVAARVRVRLARGWRQRVVQAGAPYDLVLANILARPLCAMARDLAAGLAPGGHAVLSGLLTGQVRMVLAAHQRQGLVLRRVLTQPPWATLILHKPHGERT
jgi:ribosomal protein L11 methyltransferase